MGWQLCRSETVPYQGQGQNSHWFQQCHSSSKICKKPVSCVSSANGNVPETWFWCCSLCSATTGGSFWIRGCSLDLKLWFPCSLNHLHWWAWAWAWIFSCLSKSPVCWPNASLWRPLGAQLEQATSWSGELSLICCSLNQTGPFLLAVAFALSISLTYDKIFGSHCSLLQICG